jgi:Fe-S oxidoreductase
LRPALEDMGIQMKTIYHALEDISLGNNKVQHSPKVTIHDSCSDRFEGLFAEQVRNFLTAKGFEVIEMERNRRQTFCCGSGGQVTHFDPALADKLVMMRLEEAEKTGAEVLASYCVGCALNFARIPSPLNIKHVFNLLLDIEQDFTGVKRKAKQLFSGPQGERHWAQIMTDN